MSHFFVPKAHAVQALVADLLDAFQAIRRDAMALAVVGHGFKPWPEDLYTGLWAVHPLIREGELLETPAWSTIRALRSHGALIRNAGFSALSAGAEIAPHRGYTNEVLRLHFGLLCPLEPGCELVVEGERRRWVDGEVFCFDDTLEHSAFNRTTDLRIVLIIDLNRSAYERDEAK